MKLELHLTDPKHGKFRIDMSGAMVFVIALVCLPFVAIISGWGTATIVMMMIGVTGFAHFCVCFILTIWPMVRADMKDAEAAEARKDEEI